MARGGSVLAPWASSRCALNLSAVRQPFLQNMQDHLTTAALAAYTQCALCGQSQVRCPSATALAVAASETLTDMVLLLLLLLLLLARHEGKEVSIGRGRC